MDMSVGEGIWLIVAIVIALGLYAIVIKRRINLRRYK